MAADISAFTTEPHCRPKQNRPPGDRALTEALAGVLERAQEKRPPYAEVVSELMAAEVEAAEARSHERRLRLAGFPHRKRLSDFDYSAQPNLDRRLIEKGSIILTTNRGIASWGEIFEDTTVAAAVLDRLLHRATVVQIDGESYRMRGHRERVKQVRGAVSGGGEFS